MRVANELKLSDRLIIENVNFPFIPAIASWLSTWCSIVYALLSRPFNRKVEKLCEFYVYHKRVAIAHSYGSWLLWQKMLSDSSIKFNTLIFAGSPCPHTPFPLRLHLLMDSQVKRWYNFANFHDAVAGRYSPIPFGDLGQIGIQAEEGKRERVEHPIEGRSFWNIYIDDPAGHFDHVEYFSDSNIKLMLEKALE